MGVLTDIGRAAMAKAIKEQSMFLALGTGDWDDVPPDEDTGATALASEIGRRALSRCLYVFPDEENGTLEVPTSVTTDEGGDGTTVVAVEKYSVSEEPTRHLYVEFALDFADAVGVTVRELGVYIGSKLKGDVPPGKMFFVAGDFEEDGLLFQLEHREPMLRKAQTRDMFMWVISV